VIATVFGVLGTEATGSGQAVKDVAIVRATVGPTRLVSPGFGYSVAYRTVESSTTAPTVIGLFVYNDGRWRNVTPPTLRADGIAAIDDAGWEERREQVGPR